MGKKAVGYWVHGGRGEFVGGVSIGSCDAMAIWEKLSKGTEFKPGKGVPKVVRVVGDQDLVDKWHEALNQGDVRDRWEQHRGWWEIDEAISAIGEEEKILGKGKQVVLVKAINKEGESQSSKGNDKERTGGVSGVSGKDVVEVEKVGRGKGRRVSGGRPTSKERGAGKKAKGRQGRRKGGKYMACIECYLQEEGHAGQSEWIQCDRCDGWAAVGCVRELPEGYEEEDTDWYCKQCRAIIELIQASKELRDTERYRQQEEERRKRWEEGVDRRLSEMQKEVQQGNQASIGGGVAVQEQLHKLQESMEFMVQYMVGLMVMDGEEAPDGDGEGAGMEIPASVSVPEMREWCEGKVRELKRIQETSGEQARIWWEMEKAIWENRSDMSLAEIRDVRKKAKAEAQAWWHTQEEVRRGWGQLQVVQSQEQLQEVNGETTGKGKGKGKGSGKDNCDQHQLSRIDVSSIKHNVLHDAFKRTDYTILHAKGGADVLIVKTAVESAKTADTILIGDDTDQLILLCYYADIHSKDLYLKPEPRQKTKTPRIWDIKKVKNILGEQICACLLFVHALLGCDTTSRVHGIGKPAALKKILTSDYFHTLAQTMNRGPGTPKEEIIAAGEQALVCLYNGKPGESLDALRYARFQEKVARSSKYVEAKNLPPTAAAMKYHTLRVFFQMELWKGNPGNLKPTEWG